MRSKLARGLLIACLCSPIIFTGCTKQPVPIQNPTQSAQYRVQQGLAIVADANKACIQVAISLNKSGLLTDSLTKEILNYNAGVANFAKSATLVMQSSLTGPQKAAAIKALVDALPLPDAVKGFIDGVRPEAVAGAVAAISAVMGSLGLVTTNLGGL